MGRYYREDDERDSWTEEQFEEPGHKHLFDNPNDESIDDDDVLPEHEDGEDEDLGDAPSDCEEDDWG